jgi:hypothetical protein
MSRKLTALFNELNKKYFKNRLPAYQVVYKSAVRRQGYCDSEHHVIQVLKGMGEECTRRVLLHEMCHIGTPYHGKGFLAKLNRLAKQGETWAIDEANEYQNGETWNELVSELRDSLDDVAANNASLNFTDLVRSLVDEYDFDSSEELLRKLPWLEAAWKNAKKDAAFNKSFFIKDK